MERFNKSHRFFLIEERGAGIEYQVSSAINVGLLEQLADVYFQDSELVNGNNDHYTYRIEDLKGNILSRVN